MFTVDYSDDMHIDVTPVIRRLDTPERESWLFHDRPEAPQEPSYSLIANPYGFAEWFKANTPPDQDFADIFEKRAAEYEQLMFKEAADSDPVPPQEPPFQKIEGGDCASTPEALAQCAIRRTVWATAPVDPDCEAGGRCR